MRIVVLLLSQLLFSQNYEVGYQVKYQPEALSKNEVTEDYVLTINGDTKESFFRFKSAASSDFNANIYKDFSKNIFRKYESILYKFYRTDYQFSPEWKLSSEEKEILGYACKKATLEFGGRYWEAWYVGAIPIQDGPYKFSGLPGLILEVESTDHEYKFSAVAIGKTNENIKLFSALVLESPEKEIAFKNTIIKEPSIQYKQDLAQTNLQVSASFNGKKSTDKEIIESINSSFKKCMDAHNNPVEKGVVWMK